MAAAMGAVAAHAKTQLPADLIGMFETAVRYQMYHSLALFAAAWGWTRWRHPAIGTAGVLFVVGLVFFCGSVYLRVLANAQWAAALPPVGGIAFLTGWLCLAAGAWRGKAASG